MLFLWLLPLAPPRGLPAGALGQLWCGADTGERAMVGALLGFFPCSSGVASHPWSCSCRHRYECYRTIHRALSGNRGGFSNPSEEKALWNFGVTPIKQRVVLHASSPDATCRFLKELTDRIEKERALSPGGGPREYLRKILHKQWVAYESPASNLWDMNWTEDEMLCNMIWFQSFKLIMSYPLFRLAACESKIAPLFSALAWQKAAYHQPVPSCWRASCGPSAMRSLPHGVRVFALAESPKPVKHLSSFNFASGPETSFPAPQLGHNSP